LTLISDPEEKRRGLDALMLQYGWKGETGYPDSMLERTAVLRLDAESVTGKESG
jgi:nitroimidazol reductase NimA-like FMN-containing flavoprotein (pyridoxamine 5'-phosphate oxidase superfamily)